MNLIKCNFCNGKCDEHLSEGCSKYETNIVANKNDLHILNTSITKLIIKSTEVLIEDKWVTEDTEEIIIGDWVFKRVRE